MNRAEVRKIIPLLQAFADGERVEEYCDVRMGHGFPEERKWIARAEIDLKNVHKYRIGK